MEIVRLSKGELIARKNDTVKCWYMIQDGVVLQTFGEASVQLGRNAIVGFFERDIYQCDYVAQTDCVLAEFVCSSAQDIKNILKGKEKLRSIFLKTAVEQRYGLLCLYSELENQAKNYHMFVETLYNDYLTLCNQYRVAETAFPKMEHFNALELQHKAEPWEVRNSVSIAKTYMADYLQLMSRDDGMTIGVIMETSAQMRRFAQGIVEMEGYLAYHKDIMLARGQNCLFKLFFELAGKALEQEKDISSILKDMNLMLKVAAKLRLYDGSTLSYYREICDMLEHRMNTGAHSLGELEEEPVEEIDIRHADGIGIILDYAGYVGTEKDEVRTLLMEYHDLPDMGSMEEHAYKLRKKVSLIFYDIYYRVFIRSVQVGGNLNPVVRMFLNFGFVDTMFTGEENAASLYELSAHLDVCASEHVYTIYRWLRCVYDGSKPTSKNELDMDYAEYLADQKKSGNMTAEQVKEALEDAEQRVEYEIHNMFKTVNKITYGRVTTFCPILCEKDLIYSMEKMLVTAEKIENAMNEIRKIDYSVFYREVMFSDPEKGINCEKIMQEVLPDVILLPNVGTRGIMWQETSSKRSNTPGRFMFPMFTTAELKDLVITVVGSFRWEICRKVQGVHWNDVREKSLTAEYCTYMQFYKKNRDLSADAKEKVKSMLARAKNNYREVFVLDYASWILFESKGSFRLNKVARDILVRYCPFAKAIRTELMANPIYQSSMNRFEAENAQKLQKCQMLYNKYEKAGGVITPELKENLLFYQM